MPFAFIFAGVVFTIAGVRGQSSQLLSLVKGDLTGSNNYTYWMISILVLGLLGYVDQLRPLSRAFMVLVIVVLILSNGGFFKLFESSIATITQSNSTNT